MVKDFEQLEGVFGKIFDNTESLLSSMHGEINQVIDKAKTEYVTRSSQEIYNGINSLSSDERERILIESPLITTLPNGYRELGLPPSRSDEILDLQFEIALSLDKKYEKDKKFDNTLEITTIDEIMQQSQHEDSTHL